MLNVVGQSELYSLPLNFCSFSNLENSFWIEACATGLHVNVMVFHCALPSQVVYLLCVCLSCLALGVPAPPEVHAELEKRAGLRTLGRAVRETLVSKQYLPLLKEGHRGSWLGSSGSISSWDEPVGFWERKRELLVNKRSYSDSDLTKITVNKVSHSKMNFLKAEIVNKNNMRRNFKISVLTYILFRTGNAGQSIMPSLKCIIHVSSMIFMMFIIITVFPLVVFLIKGPRAGPLLHPYTGKSERMVWARPDTS